MKGVTPVILILGLIIIAAAIGISYGSITGFFTFTPQQSAAHGANVSDSGGRGLVVGDAVPRVTGGESATQQNETQTEAQKGTTQQNTTTNQTAQNRTPAAQSSGGSPGGGGGGGGAPSSPPCSPSWSCTAWPQCSPTGSQSRTCTDVNQCGTTSGKPAETQTCEYMPVVYCENCALYITPKSLNINKSENFDIFIDINVTKSVYAIGFDLHFDASLLNASGASEGSFLKKDGASTYPVISINNTQGSISIASTRFGTQTGVNGSGTVAVISFKALGSGASDLVFEDVKIVDAYLEGLNISVLNGAVNIVE